MEGHVTSRLQDLCEPTNAHKEPIDVQEQPMKVTKGTKSNEGYKISKRGLKIGTKQI